MKRIFLVGLLVINALSWELVASNPLQAQEMAPISLEPVVDDVDRDHDGLWDSWEISVYGTDPALMDSDRDGFEDAQEIRNSFSPVGKGNYRPKDYDKDGLDDRLEILFGTNPMRGDTDGDAHGDGKEVREGLSPTTTRKERLEKTIRIRLSAQRMDQLVNGIPIATHVVSTGKKSMQTPTGEFRIMSKHPRAWSRSSGLWMPWWMQFTSRGHGIHELPEWPGGKKEGANHLGIPVSHGCVRLGVGPAKQLYDWAPIGTKIVIVR